MKNKNYIAFIVMFVIFTISFAFLVDTTAPNFTSSYMKLPVAYTYVSKEEMLEFKETGDTTGFNWHHIFYGDTNLEPASERFFIAKIDFADNLDTSLLLSVRLRYKIIELYIDGELVESNGEVGTDDIFDNVRSYYEYRLQLKKKYEGKTIIFLAESILKSDIDVIDDTVILSEDELFKILPIFSLIIVFSIYIGIFISLLAALNMYWLRLTYQSKIYKAFIPIWLFLLGVSATVPYFPLKYPSYSNFTSGFATIMFFISTMIIVYGFRNISENKHIIWFWRFIIWIFWILFSNLVILATLNIINWSFAQQILEKILYVMIPLVYVFCIVESMNLDYMFRDIIKRFLTIGLISAICAQILYYVLDNVSASTIIAILIVLWLFTLIYLSSEIINMFHSNLFNEVRKIKLDNDIFGSIEFSRTDVLSNNGFKNKKELNNFSIGYVQSILGVQTSVVSMILEPLENGEVNIIYSKNNFGKNELSKEEALFYLNTFNYIFADDEKSCVVEGSRAYLGFENDGLYYYMIIKASEFIEEVKEKALNNYALNIRDTTNNFIITRYVEQARNDVVKAFGGTIEKRIDSNNIIDVTDTFTVFVARALGKSYEDAHIIKSASYLINIGTIIMKIEYVKNYHLMNEDDLEVAYKRAIYGYRILKKFNDVILQMASIMSLYQFEKYDGSGYFGISEVNIPIECQIVITAQAMSSILKQQDIATNNIFDACMEHLSKEYTGVISPRIIKTLRNNRLLFDEVVAENSGDFYGKLPNIKKIKEGGMII